MTGVLGICFLKFCNWSSAVCFAFRRLIVSGKTAFTKVSSWSGSTSARNHETGFRLIEKRDLASRRPSPYFCSSVTFSVPPEIGASKSKTAVWGFPKWGDNAHPASVFPSSAKATFHLCCEKLARGFFNVSFLDSPSGVSSSNVNSRIATFLSSQSPPATDLGKWSIRNEVYLSSLDTTGRSKVICHVSFSGRSPLAMSLCSLS